MRRRVIIDTGPLVASLNKADRFHDWAIAELGAIEPPLLSCEAVLAETCFLLRSLRGASAKVLDLIERKVVESTFRIEPHAQALSRLLVKYADIPMSLADACLVRMTEFHEGCVVMTLDRDFHVYRRHGRQPIPLLMPPETHRR